MATFTMVVEDRPKRKDDCLVYKNSEGVDPYSKPTLAQISFEVYDRAGHKALIDCGIIRGSGNPLPEWVQQVMAGEITLSKALEKEGL